MTRAGATDVRRVLLRWHELQRSWLHIGGHGDPGEHDPPAKGNEPAHGHADLRFVLATGQPEPERPGAPLRWLTVGEARAATAEATVRESLTRAGIRLNGWSRRGVRTG